MSRLFLPQAKPFIKWVGGKTQLLSEIESTLPKDFKEKKEVVYVEPFVGGGAVLFWMLQKYTHITQAIINDINPKLITTYRVIKEQVGPLIHLLETMEQEYLRRDSQERKAYYLLQRQAFNQHKAFHCPDADSTIAPATESTTEFTTESTTAPTTTSTIASTTTSATTSSTESSTTSSTESVAEYATASTTESVAESAAGYATASTTESVAESAAEYAEEPASVHLVGPAVGQTNILTHNEIALAAQFIFLNRTCFNGLYRVNSNGAFNVPHGKYANPTICNTDNLLAVSQILQRVEILCGDFAATRTYAQPNALYYLDPPYMPISQTAAFTSYTTNGFDHSEQVRLRDFCRDIAQRGAAFIASNSDPTNYNPNNRFFDLLYSDFSIKRVSANRMVNSVGAKRGPIREVMISNL